MLIEAYRWFFLRLADVVGIGWGIVALSVITSAAMMPLMKAVAGIVKHEADYQSVILPQLAEIKKRFSSDAERHMHIQRLYARYCYSPLSAVKKVLPLFVQIPFLLLTYYMLKNTPQLSGVSFLFLDDLGQPDALLKTVGKIHLGLNILPIVMTLVNMLTVAATPGFTHKDQVQAVGISLLFLVLLYTAPSALLLYWTLNNVITMIRTLAARRGEGARLLVTRIWALRHLPSRAYGVMSPMHFAYAGMAMFVLALYFCATSWFNEQLDFQAGVLGREIAFATLAAGVAGWLHMRRVLRTGIGRCLAGVCFMPCGCLLLAILARGILTRVMHAPVMQFDTYLGAAIALVAFPLPYLVTSTPLSNWASLFPSLRCWGFIFAIPAAFAVHYSFSSEMFTFPVRSVIWLGGYMVSVPLCIFAFLVIFFSRWISADAILRFSIGICVGIYSVPFVARESGILSPERNMPIRVVMILCAAILFVRMKNRRMLCAFSLILLCVAVIDAVIFCGGCWSKQDVPVVESWKERLDAALCGAHCVRSNNVYLIIYDSYAHRSVIEGLGIRKDSGIYKTFKKHGYTVYDAYSTGGSTLISMSAAFSVAGGEQGSWRATVAGDNVLSDFLRAEGYTTRYVLGGYIMPKSGERLPGDFYFPTADKSTPPEDVVFPCIMRGSLSQSPSVFNSFTLEDWLAEKHKCMAYGIRGERTFVYAHCCPLPGHAPDRPCYRKSDVEEQRMYGERLARADEEIVKDLEMLDSDPDAIVIFASDHGAAMLLPSHEGEWDARHLIDHFGVLLAVRWPRGYEPTLAMNCLQNVPIEIMICLTGDKTLARLAPERRTGALEWPINAPEGAVKEGVIQCGRHAGWNLFDAAREMFSVDNP